MSPPAVVQKTPAAADKMPVTFPKSSVLRKSANTTMTANAKQRKLKFPPANLQIVAKQSAIPSKPNNKKRGAFALLEFCS